MRSLEEIRGRLEEQKKDGYDSIMWQASEYHPLCIYLKEYMNEGYEPYPYTREHIISQMQEYLGFAYRKAKGERGISANRSIWKYRQWLWALEDPLSEEIAEYYDYGLPQLEEIAKKYGFTWPQEEEIEK